MCCVPSSLSFHKAETLFPHRRRHCGSPNCPKPVGPIPKILNASVSWLASASNGLASKAPERLMHLDFLRQCILGGLSLTKSPHQPWARRTQMMKLEAETFLRTINCRSYGNCSRRVTNPINPLENMAYADAIQHSPYWVARLRTRNQSRHHLSQAFWPPFSAPGTKQ